MEAYTPAFVRTEGPDTLLSQRHSPGGRRVLGTDAGGCKGWRTDEDVLYGTEPLKKEITIPASTWSWTHNLGYAPIVQVVNSSREPMFARILHAADYNSLEVQLTSNETGFIIAR